MRTRRISSCIGLLIILLIASGCQEELRWGQGDPPAEFQGWFGNSNLARLSFVQTDYINQQREVLLKMAERVTELEKRIHLVGQGHAGKASHKKYLMTSHGTDNR